jgi:hypothetical protein
MTSNTELIALAEEERQNGILALYDALDTTVYGGLFDAFSADDYLALKNAGLIRSYIPAGCMAPLTKLTPKGCKLAQALRARAV